MKFYVAGKFQDYRNVRDMIDFLTEHGHEVTYDWTRTDEFGPDGEPRQTDPHNLDKKALRRYADLDLQGAMDADFLVVLANGPLCGAWIEMGAALVSPACLRIFVIEPQRWTIFMECEKVTIIEGVHQFRAQVAEGL